MALRTLMASMTVRKVWSANTAMRMAVPEARNGAICASTATMEVERFEPFGAPSMGRRRITILMSEPSDASRAATAMRPVGPAPRARVARMVPMAAGSRRRVAMARSKETQARRLNMAMIGSGRVPLLYVIQNSRNMLAMVQWATRRELILVPRRGMTSRESTSHVMMPAMREGRRIQMEAVDTWTMRPSRS